MHDQDVAIGIVLEGQTALADRLERFLDEDLSIKSSRYQAPALAGPNSIIEILASTPLLREILAFTIIKVSEGFLAEIGAGLKRRVIELVKRLNDEDKEGSRSDKLRHIVADAKEYGYGISLCIELPGKYRIRQMGLGLASNDENMKFEDNVFLVAAIIERIKSHLPVVFDEVGIADLNDWNIGGTIFYKTNGNFLLQLSFSNDRKNYDLNGVILEYDAVQDKFEVKTGCQVNGGNLLLSKGFRT